MTQSSYVIWTTKRVDHACVLEPLDGVEDIFEFARGVPRTASFPSDACFSMNLDYPRDMVVTDNLNNVNRMIIASTKLKELLHARGLVKVEYLPVAIRNHKKKLLPEPYYIVHPIEPVDCLEIDKCGARWGNVAADKIKFVKQLIIDEARVDPARELLRLKFFYEVIVARRDLAQAIDAAGCTGVRWVELKDFPEN